MQFSRPTEPAYIKVFETSNSTEIISLDASVSSDVVFDPIHRQINVTFEYNFDIEEDYHVTIPSGLFYEQMLLYENVNYKIKHFRFVNFTTIF